ncbi:hypothetical protein BC941DRAFT_441165 [Chlamydoabsidia padenii]|nr:hypothetical protein BC941DRAFT_441165 [Chlamydoabsidia padenii]
MFKLFMICVLLVSLMIPSIKSELYAYEELDCTGPASTYSDGCVDLTSIMSVQVKEDDQSWLIYPTKDCSGSEHFLAPSQLEDDGKCVSDNQNYRFIAQSARPNND